ncbi:MAG: 30S ribosomal protein S8 [Candidatus Aenigmarchaeota archaeon]|nr:30S ribosomal protein S8 [Candidatus Aenigmarchaeota archaeon]
MKHDPLADTFSVLKNMEAIGRTECIVPASSTIKDVLGIIHQHKYIGGYDFIDDGKGGKFRIRLIGKINSCGVIKPRFSVQKSEFIKWEKRYLPSSDKGILIVTTSKGIMDQRNAVKSGTGGRLLGYVY